jgi:serine/threonine protein kinase
MKLDLKTCFIELAAHFESEISVGETEEGKFLIWGKCGEKIIDLPEETKLSSFNEIFTFYHQISYGVIKGNFHFNKFFMSEGVFESTFENSELIGKGSFGFVFKCLKKSENKIYAVKIIPSTRDLENDLINELKNAPVIRKLDHDQLVKYHNFWFESNYQSPDNKTFEFAFYIQMEYCLKTLKDVISQIEINFKYKDSLNLVGFYIATELFVQILEGVHFLHNQDPRIIHRDLNPYNILVTNSNEGRYVKIADFGLMALHRFEDQSHTKDRGTINYLAPEVSTGRKYTTKADIYSLGILMQNLFLNKNE